jgi:quercetin dioxygenase-like cupin family protein
MSDLRIPGATGVAVSQAADRPHWLWAGGMVFDVVLGAEHTGGSLALLDQRGRQGDATPMHVHRREAEVFYVIEGAITAWAGEAAMTLGSGGAVYLPAGLPHALRVDSDQARVITLSAPAGFADFVRAAAVRSDGDVPAAWEFDVERIVAAAPQHDIDIVGPPPHG